MEILPRLHHLNLAPAFGEKGVALRCDGGILRAPELVAVGEYTIFSEQVGNDPPLVGFEREQGVFRGNRHAAKQP